MKHLYPFFIAIVTLVSCKKELTGKLLLQGVNIINVKTGEINGSMDVLITGDSISNIEQSGKFEYAVQETIDGSGKYLIPGLWDMHGHWVGEYEHFFPMMLANGVVGFRDMWGNLPVLKKVRNKISKGELIGPDIYSAGFLVAGPNPSHPGASVIANTPERGREIVRDQKTAGADFIKVYSGLERDVYFAIADECRKQNIPLAGHIPRKITVEEAIEANQLSFEHFYQVKGFLHPQYENYTKLLKGEEVTLELTENIKAYTEYYGVGALDIDIDSLDNKDRLPELIELLANSNSYIAPTLVLDKGFFRKYDPAFDPTTLNSYMPDYAIADYYVQDTLKTKQDTAVYDWSKKQYRLNVDLLRPMFDGGVKFLAGTDHVVEFCYPGFSLHDELQLFVEEGNITPLQALQTATINATEFLNIENKTGTVEKGKTASLLLLNGNPLDDIRHTRDIDGLILRGEYLPKEKLNNELEKLTAKSKLPLIRKKMDRLIKQHGIDKAIERYRKMKKDSPEAYNFDPKQLVMLGHYLLDAEQIDEAIKIFELNIEMFPGLSHSYNGLGDAYFEAGEKTKAKEAWEKANELGGYATYDKLEKLTIEKLN